VSEKLGLENKENHKKGKIKLNTCRNANYPMTFRQDGPHEKKI